MYNMLYIHVHVDDRYVCSDVHVLSIVHVGDDVSAHNKDSYISFINTNDEWTGGYVEWREGILSGGRVC